MLECVINVSEGKRLDVVEGLAAACTSSLLDVHSDAFHNRTVFTLGGPDVEVDARNLTSAAVAALDIRSHTGVHPRIGVVDVVPFVPLPDTDATLENARIARDEFASWIAHELQVPAFLYGSDRTLPEIRKGAFVDFAPDFGPTSPHETAGAVAVGCRNVLVAYNIWLVSVDETTTRAIAKSIRTPNLRTLGLTVGDRQQVSCNLVNPHSVGPEAAYEAVADRAEIAGAELVGLIPRSVLHAQSKARWADLDISEEKTIEARLSLSKDGPR